MESELTRRSLIRLILGYDEPREFPLFIQVENNPGFTRDYRYWISFATLSASIIIYNEPREFRFLS